MNHTIHYANYSPEADIIVAATCFVMIVLVSFSYINRTRSSRMFLAMVGLVFSAACADITFYMLATSPALLSAANWTRCLYHGLLFLIFVYYIAYICEVTQYDKPKPYLILANLIFAAVMIPVIPTWSASWSSPSISSSLTARS